ncbi:MAG: extracellular solute-binding protein [Clostridiales bacterium]
MKKKLLNFYLLIFINFIIASNFTTCSKIPKDNSQKINDETIKMTMWHQWTDKPNLTNNLLKKVINKWNTQNVKIKIIDEGVNVEQYKTKIRTALAVGEAPDIFFMWNGSFVEPYIESKNILYLDPFLNDEIKDRMLPKALDSFTHDGKIYGMPTFTFIANLYCNKELFDKANAKIPSTYDELLESIKLLRQNGITPIVVGERDRWPGMYWYDILAMRQAGNSKCIEALNNPKLYDQSDFREAARKLIQLVRMDAFNDNIFGIGFKEMQDDYINGEAAMIYQGNWIEPIIENSKTNIKNKTIAVTFPIIEDGNGNSKELLGGNVDGFYINMDTKYKKESVEALIFICENTSKEGYLSGEGLPCWKTQELDQTNIPSLTKKSFSFMKSGSSFIEWWDTIFPASEADVHKNLVAKLFADKISPENFAKEMSKLKGDENYTGIK